MARVVGETAPLIMTAFGNPVMNANPFQGPQDALPLASFRLFRLYTGSAVQMAWTYAAVLVLLVLILFVAARRTGRRRAPLTL